ncbi:MAG: SPFH/Band 7/PHB domain protein [Campylobacteraceae bacterium]|jgi:regulator of protease activity HflC (stomatin/prohibitin superfamily)|nr:SPFH/Band 7/PHB domain protein [Campylobacteraceae bacterium]
MGGLSVFLIAVAIVVVLIIYKGVVIVPQAEVHMVERLGKFSRSLSGGFHIIIPFFDRVQTVLSTKEHIINIPRQPVITRDNVTIQIDGIVFIAVVDAYKTTYNVTNYQIAVANLALTTLRSEIGSMTLDEILSNREKINSRILIILDDAGSNWGTKVTRIEISDIAVPKEIQEAMSMQMKAEREKRAIELKAQAEKEAVIRQSEAYKAEQFLKAEAIERLADAEAFQVRAVAKAQQEAMNMISEAMSRNEKSAEYLLAKDRISAFNELAKNPSKDKIVVPYEAVDLVGSLTILKDMFKKTDK